MHHRPLFTPLRTAALIALLAVGSIALPTAGTDRVVVVESGDTLSAIALRHGVTLARLLALNTIADPNRIYPGQRLRLSAEPAATPTPVAVRPTAVVHIVRAGEHLTGIAQRYGSSIAAIARANKIANPSYLRVGQRLSIPGTTAPATANTTPAAAAPSASTQVHTVAAGETLSGIAQRYRTTIAAIAKANAITDPSYLRVGQRLSITGTPAYGTPGMSSAMSALVAARGEIGAMVAAEATAQGVPLAFALAVAWQESGWRDDVISPAGAVGVMQLTPPTADWVAGTMLHASIDLHDARSNVRAGVRLLKHYLARYGGDKALVLAAYYQGQTAADRHGVYAISRSYIAGVLALESLFAR